MTVVKGQVDSLTVTIKGRAVGADIFIRHDRILPENVPSIYVIGAPPPRPPVIALGENKLIRRTGNGRVFVPGVPDAEPV